LEERLKKNVLPFELLPGVVAGIGDGLNILIFRIGFNSSIHGQNFWLLLGLHPSHVHDDDLQEIGVNTKPR
jgi:hypothetical protein